MFIPQVHRSSKVLADTYGDYVLARLRADVDTHAVLPAFEMAQEALRVAWAGKRAARRTMREMLAQRMEADRRMQRHVSRFEAEMLARVERNRRDRMYECCFPDGIGDFGEIAIEKRLARVDVLILFLARVVEGGLGDEALTAGAGAAEAWLPRLVDERGRWVETIRLWNEARLADEGARKGERTERVNWRVAYRELFGNLTAQFARDPGRVEGYFRAGPKVARGGGGGAVPERL